MTISFMMPQTSQIPTKYHVDSRYTRLRIRQIPLGSVNDEKSNSNRRGNDPLQFPAKSVIGLYVGEASSAAAFIRLDPFKVASKSKYSHYNTISTYSPACFGTSMSSCKRSHSMIDLSSLHFDPENSCSFGFEKGPSSMRSEGLLIQTFGLSHLAIDPCKSLWGNQVIEKKRDQLQEMIKKAASAVCHALMLNAWRRRREENGKLCETIQQLTQQIDHLQLQTVVLRRLLDTENNRVGQLGIEIQRARIHSENMAKEKTELVAEKHILENENEKLKAAIEERMVKLENCNNELLSTKSQLKAVEAQIIRNHKKLSKLREDKKFLLEKVSMNEMIAAECSRRVDQAEVVAKDLRTKLEAKISIIDGLQDDNHKLSRELCDAEAEKIRLNECMLVIHNTDRATSLRAANLTIQLYDREAALRRIESAYNTQLIELDNLRQQRQQSRWCQTVLQIAGSMMRAPRAIMRSILFLSPTSL